MDILPASRPHSLLQDALSQVAGYAMVKLGGRFHGLQSKIHRERVAIGRAHLALSQFETPLVRTFYNAENLLLGAFRETDLNYPDQLTPVDKALPIEMQRIIRRTMAQQKAQEAREMFWRSQNDLLNPFFGRR